MILNDRNVRSTGDALDQVCEQLRAERAEHAAHVAELNCQIAVLLGELAEARVELVRRDMADAFARQPSPSAMMH